MRSMTFLVNDRSTGGRIPAVAVTITENDDGSLSFELKVIGLYTGDLRGFFFDIADESHIGKLSVKPTSPGFTEFQQGNDNIKDLGNGANMQGLVGSDGGYDAGIEIGTPGIGKDDYQSFSFTLESSAGPLTLEDFSNVDFGLRLTSVGFDGWGGRDGGAKLLEHTSSAIDAIDDANEIDEDQTPNSVGGNVFANDENLECAHFITAVNGSAWNVGHEVEGTYGTLRLKLDGSYTYTLKPAAQTLADGQTVTETFSYTAKSFDEFSSFSTDSAFLNITITGANDAPQIVAGTTSGQVFEDGSRTASGQLVAMDVDLGSQLVWSVTGSGPMTPRADYRFLLDNLSIVRDGVPFFNDDFGSGGPPPAAPAFNYFTFGTFTESGGRTIMDGGLGAPTTIPGALTVIAHLATLNTDVGPDISQRLNRAQDFKVEARFDLVIPAEERSSYAVRLSDLGDDIVEVGVRRMEDGSVAVALREVDVAATIPVILEAIALEPAPGDQQIVLRLQHTANTNIVTASFDVLNGGVVTQTRSFTATADIFSNEDWTRPQVIGQAIATPQNGVYGTLSVEADGEWHYAMNNAAANVQALAQGEEVTDTFTVTVTDEHGAYDTEMVTIDVTGSNDAPVITGGTNFGFVAEDTPTQTATGQLFASDVDHGAVLRWSAGPSSSLPFPGVPGAFQFFGYSSDYHFTVDQFTIERDGAVIFSDPFSDGIAPPSAPPFSNGTLANYLTNGARFGEAGDRAVLDGSLANAVRGIGLPDLTVGHIAVLATNIDAADLTRGLKADDDFEVEARFDLVTPGVRQGYGLSLTDSVTGGLPADQLGDDSVNLFVRADADGNLSVHFSRFDIPADTVTLYQSLGFTPEDDETQIVLRLIHDDDQAGVVRAEFDLLGGEDGPRTIALTQTGHIFGSGTPGYSGDDENWTRAQIVAFGDDTGGATFEGTYGSLTVDQHGNWTYTLDNDSPLVQALPGPLPPQPGEPPQILPQDNISVRVVDEHGMSSFRVVSVAVAGTNDAPDITGGTGTGLVYEDGGRVATGQLAAVDIDNGPDLLTWEVSIQGTRGTAQVDATGKWIYTLRNEDSALVQSLPHGALATDTFTVRARDEFGASDAESEQVVTIDIRGTNDRPAIFSVSPPPPTVNEDGAQVFFGQVGTFDIDTGDTRQLSLSHGTPFGYRSNFVFSADEFTIARNGVQILHDTFDDGVVPNSPPDPLYFTSGQLSEQDGKLIFDGSKAGTFRGAGFDGLVAGMDAVVNTNIDSANTTNGLKLSHDFTVEAVFDLVIPVEVRQGYGLSLSDSNGGPLNLLTTQTGDDSVDLNVRRDADDGQVYVRFTSSSAVADSGIVLQRELLPLDTAADQIRLRLDHTAGSPEIRASFELLDDGSPIGPATVFAARGLLFGADTPGFVADDEAYTRASLSISGLDADAGTTTLGGVFGTLSVLQDGSYTYALNNFAANVQALAQGELAIDPFHIRATDPRGVSAALPVNINVFGSNDPVVITSGPQGGTVVEDAATTPSPDDSLSASSTITFADPDLADFHSAFFTPAPTNTTALGFFSLGFVDEAPNAANGSVSWTYNLDNFAAQTLAQGQTVFETYTVTAQDFWGGFATQDVTIAIVGTDEAGGNSPPDITGGTASGLVYEDGARVAQGSLSATDPEGSALSWSVPFGPAFGFAGVDASGQWTYTLDNTRFEVQQLAQGATLNDSFLVRVSDQHGAFDFQSEQLVAVEIKGADDRPFVNSPPAAPLVSEDFALNANGNASAFDVDSGAQLAWSLSRGTVLGYRSNNHVEMDRFSIVKNGALIFDDTFSDGVAPPSSPNPMAGYLANGFYAEMNDRLIMDGAGGVGFTGVDFEGLLVGHSSLLNTNTDPADTVLGLKSNHDFIIEGVFDLVVPDEPREAYGIQLTDALPNFQNLALNLAGDDQLALLVRKSPEADLVYVELLNFNTVTDTVAVAGSVLLDPEAGDQIRLRLSHDDATPGIVTASFDYLNGEAPTVLASTLIFGADTPDFLADNENWTRAGFQTLSPDQFEHTNTLPGLYGTLSIDSATGFWNYTLDNAAPHVQALAQGQVVSDNFHLRVTDEYGLSNSQPLNVTAFGSNDPVVITSGPQGGTVVEDADTTPSPGDSLSASGTITYSDIDLIDGHWATFMPSPTNNMPLGTFVLGLVNEEPSAASGSVSWTYNLDNAAAQHLAQGQTVFETYTVTVQDSWGSFATQDVTIAITGTDDGPGSNTPPVAVDDVVPEQVSENEQKVINALANDFDVDHDPILVRMHNSFSVLGARITLGPDGTLNYDPTTSATLQDLDPGQFLNDSFTYVITDTKADSLPATVTVTVFGVAEEGSNTPPDITGGTATGQVYEDGAASVARGQLFAVDPDMGALNWSFDQTPETLPTFGFVNVVPHTGEWTYFLNSGAVQQLAQGGSIQDDFVVRVTDNHGASDTQTVTINITGTGDRPFFTTPAPVLSVGEDGPFVSGQMGAADVDNGTVLHWSLNRGSALGYFSDYEFRADSFSIEKNGAPLFHDEFDAGGPPPSAPDFIPPPPPGGSSAANYGTPTGMFQEIGGKLVMRGSEAFAFRGTGNNALVVGNEAILSTNNDPANLQGGLKQNHQFVVEGVFDLLEPGAARYGLTLTDGAGRVADDLLGLTVFRDPGDNKVYVQFANSNAVLDSTLPVERHLLSPDGGVPDGVDQIRLKLTHEAGASHMSASYELLSGGSVVDDGELGQAGIFGSDTPGFAGDDENWIRAGLFSSGIDAGEFTQTLAGAYGTLTVDSEVPFTGQLVYTPGPAAQALRQGENVTDTFFVRVVDQQGMSTSQGIDVTVMGADDLPVAVPDANSVIEEVVITVMGNVLTNDFDLDHDTTLSIVDLDTLSVVDTAEYDGLYGTLTISANGSYVYMLDPVLAGPLGRGDIVFDTFEGVFGVTDGFFTSSAILEIRVIGTASEVVPPDPAPDVVGDGSDNVLVGTPTGERFYGGGGADLLVGLGGSDVFDYDSLSEGGDTIADFATGSGGDILDLEDLVQGDTSNPADFVQLQANGPNTTVLVDGDGAGSDYQPLATLQGVSGLSFEDFSAHNLLL